MFHILSRTPAVVEDNTYKGEWPHLPGACKMEHRKELTHSPGQRAGRAEYPFRYWAGKYVTQLRKSFRKGGLELSLKGRFD